MRRNGNLRGNYSASPDDYNLLEEVGYGASATVYRGLYLPTNEVVAVKRLDLDRCNSNLIAYPDGFEESVICSILKETLKALEYLHRHGHIHRDVKAGNILLDKSGVVKLGDFGVSACMFDKGDRQRSRNTFVGTPCWMAPEVLQPGSGYDFKADIWSFGITALELAHGHAPFSKYPPMKILLMTLQNAPPGLDYDRDKKFSKSFKEMIAMCLVKDQTKRPTVEKLLKHSFFKHAKPPEISLKGILNDLPPLWDRVKALQLTDAAQLALKKMPSSEQEALSQSEYQRGVSAWNFDIEDLKAQASLLHDDPDLIKEEEETIKSFVLSKHPSILRSNDEKPAFNDKTNSRVSPCGFSESKYSSSTRDEILQTDIADSSNQSRFDQCERSRMKSDEAPSTSKRDTLPNQRKVEVGKKHQSYSGPLVPSGSERVHTSGRVDRDNQQGSERYIRDTHKVPNFSGPLMLPNRASANSLSAPMRSSTGCGDLSEDKTKPSVVQIKGRFSVTSENVDLVKDLPLSNISRRSTQVSPLRKSASVGDWLINLKPVTPGQPPIGIGNSNPKEVNNSTSKEVGNNVLPASILMPHLQNLFQQTSFQQGLMTSLLNSLQQSEIIDLHSQAQNVKDEKLLDAANSERERVLLSTISELQARMITLTDELTLVKLQHIQLQHELHALYNEEDDKRNKELEET